MNSFQIGGDPSHSPIMQIQGGDVAYRVDLKGPKYLNEARQIDKLFETNPELTIILGKNPSGKQYKAEVVKGWIKLYSRNGDGKWSEVTENIQQVLEDVGYKQNAKLHTGLGSLIQKTYPRYDGDKVTLKGQQTIHLKLVAARGRDFSQADVRKTAGAEKPAPAKQAPEISKKVAADITQLQTAIAEYKKAKEAKDPKAQATALGKIREAKNQLIFNYFEPPILTEDQQIIRDEAEVILAENKPAQPKAEPKAKGKKAAKKTPVAKTGGKPAEDGAVSREFLKSLGVTDTNGNGVDIYDLDLDEDGYVSREEAAKIGINEDLYNVILNNMNAESVNTEGELHYGSLRKFNEVAQRFGKVTGRDLKAAVELYKKCKLANVDLDALEAAHGNITAAIAAQIKGIKLTPTNLAAILKKCGYANFIITSLVAQFGNTKEITPEQVASKMIDLILGSGFKKDIQKDVWKILEPLKKLFPFKTSDLTAENIASFIAGQEVQEREIEGAGSTGAASASRLRTMTPRQLWVERQKLIKEQKADSEKLEKMAVDNKGYFAKKDKQFVLNEDGTLKLTPIAENDPAAKLAAQEFVRLSKKVKARQDKLAYINSKLKNPNADPMYKLAFGKYQEVLDDPNALPIDKAHAHLLKAGDDKQLIKTELKEHPQKYAGIDSDNKQIKELKQAAMLAAIKPKKAENYQAAKKLLEDKYFENGKLKADVPEEEKAIALYLYAQALVDSAKEKDKESAGQKATELIQEAGKYTQDIPDYHPLKERITKITEAEAERIKDLPPGQMAYEKVMNDPKSTLAQKVAAQEAYAAELKKAIAASGTEITEKSVKIQLAYIRSLSRTMDFVELEKTVTTLLAKYKDIPEDLQPAAKATVANAILNLLGGGLYSDDLPLKLFDKYSGATGDNKIKLSNDKSIDRAKIEKIVKGNKEYKGSYSIADYDANRTGMLIANLTFVDRSIGKDAADVTKFSQVEDIQLRTAFVLKKYQKKGDTNFLKTMTTWANGFYRPNEKLYKEYEDLKDPRGKFKDFASAMKYLESIKMTAESFDKHLESKKTD